MSAQPDRKESTLEVNPSFERRELPQGWPLTRAQTSRPKPDEPSLDDDPYANVPCTD